ncbi:hypothetical protein FOZ60_004404 [Perkinsus olseni]|uniref:Uncharacterized protein n=1 Tax=Perkinsus olseni TaxID=32597 RepID=A0A7J6PND3_PEROL|nr:hypothetical protein FOZ60_004404 [Perkinsus olseni]
MRERSGSYRVPQGGAVRLQTRQERDEEAERSLEARRMSSILMKEALGEERDRRRFQYPIARYAVFTLTLGMFLACIVGLIYWNTPSARLGTRKLVEGNEGSGQPVGGYMNVVYLVLTLMAIVAVYLGLPILAAKTRLSSTQTPAKPFLSFYHCSFILLLPGLVLIGLGYGRLMSMGDKVGELYDGIGISVTQLNLQQPAYGSYIHAADGFVAINLTKSVVRTLRKKPVLPWDTMYEAPSLGKDDEGLPIVPTSRYHEVVVVTTDDWPSKTDVDAVHPDARSQWTVAPVFARYHWCLSEPPPVHITCSSANVISAWAIARSKSVCHALQMTACSTKSAVEIPTYPAYDCDIPERKDIADIDPAVNETRLCAEVTWPPSEDAKQEIFRR